MCLHPLNVPFFTIEEMNIMAEIQKDFPVKPYQGDLHYEGDLGGSDIKNSNLSNPKSGKAINGVAIKGTNGAKFV